MPFTPLVRWRNFTLDNFKAILEIYPDLSREIPRSEVNNILEDRIKGYTKTVYQFACQLGLENRGANHLEVQNYLFTFSDENLRKYLEFWIKTYYAPNPFVQSTEQPFIIYRAIAEEILQADNLRVDFGQFFENRIGGKSYDILINVIEEFGSPIKKVVAGGKDYLYIDERSSGELQDLLRKLDQDFSVPGNYSSKEAFFRRYNYSNFAKFFDIDTSLELLDNEQDETPEAADMPLQEIPYDYNRILVGAPGTGKSYKILVESQGNGNLPGFFKLENIERVTFYPNYSYSQFVGTYKPRPIYKHHEKSTPYSYKRFRADQLDEATAADYEIMNEPHVTYEYVAGPLLRLLTRAIHDYETKRDIRSNYLLIIEEINRANVASVFGDIFQLLDRDSSGRSEYDISVSEEMEEYLRDKGLKEPSRLYIPPNFYIWCTMNSADQGVNPMDTAFKRRWSYEYIGIDENEEAIGGIEVHINGYGNCDWNKFRKALNRKLIDLEVKEDKQIGPFFIKKEDLDDRKITEATDSRFQNAFKNKLLIYLAEDVFKHNRKPLFGGNRTLSQILEAYRDGRKIFNDMDEDFIISEQNFEQDQ